MVKVINQVSVVITYFEGKERKKFLSLWFAFASISLHRVLTEVNGALKR